MVNKAEWHIEFVSRTFSYIRSVQPIAIIIIMVFFTINAKAAKENDAGTERKIICRDSTARFVVSF